MSRRAAFTQADIARLLRGARAAGETVRRIEIDGAGSIVAELAPKSQDDGGTDDEWMRALHARRQRAAAERH